VNEYLTTRAFQALLADDDVVDLKIGEINGFSELALIIKRFDRVAGERVHFEEFNQLLDRKSADKYEASHRDMANFIRTIKGCLPAENYRLYARILVGILLGNTDMHLKNFSMFHRSDGFRLTPSYDQVSAVIYNYKTLALSIGGASNLRVSNLKPKHVLKLGEEFGLLPAAIDMLIQRLLKNMPAAKQAITEALIGSSAFKNQLIKLMETRWNGTFALIGQSSSKKL
jgi:serine/threonine-protein kinase HipA